VQKEDLRAKAKKDAQDAQDVKDREELRNMFRGPVGAAQQRSYPDPAASRNPTGRIGQRDEETGRVRSTH
jgi:hypothetical protein